MYRKKSFTLGEVCSALGFVIVLFSLSGLFMDVMCDLLRDSWHRNVNNRDGWVGGEGVWWVGGEGECLDSLQAAKPTSGSMYRFLLCILIFKGVIFFKFLYFCRNELSALVLSNKVWWKCKIFKCVLCSFVACDLLDVNREPKDITNFTQSEVHLLATFHHNKDSHKNFLYRNKE